MMEFQNTERCTPAERLKIVSKEVMQLYPKIKSADILKIANLCDTVSDYVDPDVIFRRYYYILLVIQDDRINFDVVYNDMIKLCDGNLEKELNKYLYNDIKLYYDGNLDSFPMISNYYGEE